MASQTENDNDGANDDNAPDDRLGLYGATFEAELDFELKRVIH
jgi:hypothetical protein